MKAQVWSDGACFGNPGPMGLGIVLKLPTNQTITKSIPAGEGTNNKAEYLAALEAIKLAIKHGATSIEAYADSELLVKQINGDYKIKNEELKKLYEEIQEQLLLIKAYTITHIRREQNNEADELSKTAAENN